ncbi:MAG: Hsp70 family protein [Bacteroidales bacterium]
MEKIYGIDLGTTYSCIAHVDEFGKPVIIANMENERTTPSVIFLETPENIIVGTEAKNQLRAEPQKVASFIKRNMGDPHFIFHCHNRDYRPEELSAYILRKLAHDASEKMGQEVKNVVITCPAYFGINEREATRKAGQLAGLNVMHIINEPTSAALAYGMEQVQDQTVLVYDLGGGTFDVTIISVKQDAIEVVVTGGDHNLGGKNWDNSLMEYLSAQFLEKTGLEPETNIFASPETYGDLQIGAENAKKTLSQRDKTRVTILWETYREAVEVSRETFDDITAAHLQRTIMLTDQLLEEAKAKNVFDFDKILLVGGSTRMPQISQALEMRFPGKTIEFFDPDESVAKGAAIYGHNLMINGELIKRLANAMGVNTHDIDLENVPREHKEKVVNQLAGEMGTTTHAIIKSGIKITNVVSKTFGVKTFNSELNRTVVFNMIMKQTAVPAEITDHFETLSDNQRSVEIAIFENETTREWVEIADAVKLGEGSIEGLPAHLPKGSPIEITFRINAEGRLEVHAIETTGKNECQLTIETTSVISDDEMSRVMQRNLNTRVS